MAFYFNRIFYNSKVSNKLDGAYLQTIYYTRYHTNIHLRNYVYPHFNVETAEIFF